MKVVIICLLLSCSLFANQVTTQEYHAFSYAGFTFPEGIPATVYYQEQLRVPLLMNYMKLQDQQLWVFPEGTHIEAMSSGCPPITSGYVSVGGQGQCLFHLIIAGHSLGSSISGSVLYQLSNKKGSNLYGSGDFKVKVIPHPLSMLPIPGQQATANHDFYLDLKSSVKYYAENELAGQPAQAEISPQQQNGLFFDKTAFAIRGRPTKVGVYHFQVAVKNAYGASATTSLNVLVNANPKETPVFKVNYQVAAAIPNQHYQFHLVSLIEPQAAYMNSNQLSFRIQNNSDTPPWLSIAPDDPTLLIGDIPASMAGKEVVLHLIASSNAGGDSAPTRITIPIAYDPRLRPSLKPFTLEKKSGTSFNEPLVGFIDNPAQDNTLQLILEKIEPYVPWLSIAPYDPTMLEGTILMR